MTDLDRELRALLEQDVRQAPSAPAPEAAIRRARRRQLAFVAGAVAIVAALAIGSVAGASALFRSSERRIPVEPPDTFAPGRLESVETGTHEFGALTAAADGTLWGSGRGLVRFDPASGAVRTYMAADDRAFEDVWVLAPARGGGVWIASFPDGTQLGDGPTIRRFDGERFQQGLGSGPVCDVAETPDGTVWGSGCEGVEGVFIWKGSSWARAPGSEGSMLGGGAIAVDAEGNVWLANRRYPPDADAIVAGISRFDGTSWTTWTERDGLPSDAVEAITPGSGGDVWVATSDGVARFVDGSWTAYPGSATGIPDVWSIALSDDLALIAGYVGNESRFALFDGTTWTPVTAGNGLGTTSSEPSVAAGADGVLWAATRDAGLFRFDGLAWRRVLSGLAPEEPFGLLAAAGPDELWGTPDLEFNDPSYRGFRGGLWRLQDGVWTRFGEKDGLPRGRVGGIAVGPDDALWAAMEDGLARFDGSSWETVEAGPHYAVAVAADDTVWVSTGSAIRPVGGRALPGPIPLSEVTTFIVGPGEEVWAGCPGFTMASDCHTTLAHFDGGAWEAVRLPTAPEGLLDDFEFTVEGDVWISANTPAGRERWVPSVWRYRNGTWTEFAATDTGVRLDEPVDDPSLLARCLETTPEGHLLLLARDTLFVLRDRGWSTVVEGGFSEVATAPDGTIWLSGNGLFRLAGPSPSP